MPCVMEDMPLGLTAEDVARPKLDELTRLLCLMCQHTPIEYMPDEVATWWKKHTKHDADRLRREIADLKKKRESTDTVLKAALEELAAIERRLPAKKATSKKRSKK